MAKKRTRISIDLGENLYDAAKREADKKFLGVGVYLRMIVAERLAQLQRRRSKGG